MYNFRDLRVWSQKRRKVHTVHKRTEARCWHYMLFSNQKCISERKHLLQSRQQ